METLDPGLVKITIVTPLNWENIMAAGREVMDRRLPPTPEQQLVFLEHYFPDAPHVKRLEAIGPELALLLV